LRIADCGFIDDCWIVDCRFDRGSRRVESVIVSSNQSMMTSSNQVMTSSNQVGDGVVESKIKQSKILNDKSTINPQSAIRNPQ